MPATVSQVAFIVNNVDDYQSLAAAIPSETAVYILDASSNVLEQMGEILGSYENLDAIHLFSHGESGSINLGSSFLDADNIENYAGSLASIGRALSETGDILIYGCDVANGESGISFINKLSKATGADIAASDDLTGSTQKGGNWTLERSIGNTDQSNYLAITSYDQLLLNMDLDATPSKTATSESDIFSVVDGSTIYLGAHSYNAPSSDFNGVNSGYFYNISNFDASSDRISVISWAQQINDVTITISNSADEYSTAESRWNTLQYAIFATTGYITDGNSPPIIASQSIPPGTAVIGTAGAGEVSGTIIFLMDPNIDMIGVFLPNVTPTSLTANNFIITAGPSVTLSANNSSIAEAAGTSTITATLSAVASTDTIITLSTSGTATGNGTDYTLSSPTITIAAGDTTGTAIVTAVQDSLNELDETVVVGIASVMGGDGATENGTQQATITITDDDPEPSLSISNVSQAEGNSGTNNMTFTVTLSTASGQAVTVAYATSDGTAAAGSDYTAASGTLSFAAGETSKTFTVAIAGDTTTEPDETFTVTLSTPTHAALGTSTATGTITNDENAAPTLSAPGTVTTYTDTSAADNFTSYTGTLSGLDPENNTLTYGITSPTSTNANYTVGSITYDVSRTGVYGTLYVESTAGAYIYVPNNNAINAVPSGSSPTDSFSVTVADSSHTGSPTSQTLTVAITGGNDAPTAISLSGTTASTYDSAGTTVGSLTRTDVDGGGPTYSVVSVDGNTSGVTYNYFTVSGATLQITNPTATPAGDYTVVIRVNDGTSDYDQSFNLSVSNTLVVDTVDDELYGDGGSTYTGEKADGNGLSLREAIGIANQAGGGTISFASGLGTALTLGTGVSLTEDITLDADVVNNISIAGDVTTALNKTLTLSNATGDALTLSGNISGDGSLVKTGAGTLTLSGTSSNFTGGITVTGGALSVASNTPLSSGTLTLDGGDLIVTSATTINNAVVLSQAATVTHAANLTLAGVLSGSGTLTKTGAGTLTLSGDNTRTGATTVSAGTLMITSSANLGSNSAPITLASGTTLAITGSDVNIDNAISLSGDSVIQNTNTITLSGAISGAGTTLTKSGAGTLTLSNTSNATATTTALTVTGGTVSVDSSSTMVGGTLTLNGGNLTITSADNTFDNAIVLSSAATLTNANATTLTGAITGSGALTKMGAGTLILTGTNSSATSTLTVTAGAVSVSSDAQLVGGLLTLNGGTLSLNNAGTVDNAIALGSGNGSIDVTSGAATLSSGITGTGSLTKLGTGTLTLSGNNTYTGNTTVSAGTLVVDGTLAGSTLGVASTAKLTGSGTINEAVTVNSAGSIEAGVSVGILTLNNGLTIASGGTLAAEVKGTTAGTGYDQISVVGAVDITGATLSIDLGSFTPAANNTFTLIENDGNDAVTGTFNGLAEGATFTTGGRLLQISYVGGTGNDVVLMGVPNPTVQSVSANTSDGLYKVGDEIEITVTFSTNVTVNTASGTPSLLLSNDGRSANYLSGSSTNTLTFKYTVQAGDSSSDLNYASINALVLNGGSIVDAVSNTNATLELPATGALESLGGSKNIVIDGIAPVTLAAPTLDVSSNSGSTIDTITNDTTPTVSGSGAESGATVTLYDTDGTTVLGTSTADGTGNWSITSSVLSEGTHALKVRQTDLAGNNSSLSNSLSLNINSSLPSDIALASNNIPQSLVIAQTALTSLSTTDVTPADEFTYSLVTGTGSTDNALFVLTGNTLKAASSALAVGTYSIRVKTTDSAGNTFEKALSITINNNSSPTPTDPTTPNPTTPTDQTTPDPTPQDTDGDGIPQSVEDQVPSRSDVSGDGNGDGIADSQQNYVSSAPFLETSQVSQDTNAPVVYLTLESNSGTHITSITQQDAPTDQPSNLSMPFGLISFTAVADTSGSTSFTLFVDSSLAVNGYWKQDSGGNWVNLASAEYGGQIITENGTTRLEFTLQDGGEFDDDGLANGIITDPGALGFLTDPDSDHDQFPDALEAANGLSVGIQDNDVFSNSRLFVMQLYRDVLGREADPEGLTYWQNQLNSGLYDRATLVSTFLDSPEFQSETGALIRLSLSLQGRLPDQTELSTRLDQLHNGSSLETVLNTDGLMTSYDTLTDTTFIYQLYQNVLGRNVDADGLAFWTQQIANGETRSEVLLQFTESSEYKTQTDSEVTLALIYQGLLGRAPDQTGFDAWQTALQQGLDETPVIQAFLDSAEYHDRFLPSIQVVGTNLQNTPLEA